MVKKLEEILEIFNNKNKYKNIIDVIKSLNCIPAKLRKDKNPIKGECLKNHLIEVGTFSKELLKSIDKHLNKDKEYIKEVVLYSSYLHDIGKATDRFIFTLINNERSTHPLYALPISWIIDLHLCKKYGILKNCPMLVTLTILTHHSDYHKELYMLESDEFEYLDKLDTILEPLLKNYLNCKDSLYMEIKKNILKKDKIKLFIKTLNERVMSSIKDKEFVKKYILTSGSLINADWICSSKKQQFSYKLNNMENKVMEYLKSKAYGYQRNCSNTKYEVLIAPTGSGKTEASLFRASKKGRVIIGLPTTISSEGIYKRLIEIFKNKDLVGKLYGDVINTLKEKSELSKYNIYQPPLMASTIDSVILRIIKHGKHWNAALFNIINSTLVVDEVHSYNPFMLGVIISAKKMFNLDTLFMSATFPEIIYTNYLSIKPYNVLLAREFENKKLGGSLKIIDGYIDISKILEIIEKEEKRKVLIIVNKIDTAIRIYEKLNKLIKGYKIFLHHSRFKLIDRERKDDEVIELENSKGNIILVATSTVEVSLDIDYDILITEVTMFENFIQRMGRVNRKGKKKESSVYLFAKTDVKYLNKYLLKLCLRELEQQENETITFFQANKMINSIYENLLEGNSNEKKEFESCFESGKRYVYENVYGGGTNIETNKDSIEIREKCKNEKNMKTLSILLEEDIEIINKLEKEDEMEKEVYLKKIDIYLYEYKKLKERNLIDVINKKNINLEYILKEGYSYDKDKGLIIKKSNEAKMT